MPPIMICLSFVSLVVAPPSHAPPRPNLEGTWALNRAQSDDARAMLEERQRASGRARRPGRDGPGMGDGGGGMGGRPGGRMGGGGGAEGGVERERARNVMQSVLEAPVAFTITQHDTALVFDYGKGRTTVLFTDGETLTENLDGIGYVDTRTRWEKQRVVVDRRFDVGGRLVEEYSLSPDTGQLVVAIEFVSPRTGKLKFRRVYDPTAAPPGD